MRFRLLMVIVLLGTVAPWGAVATDINLGDLAVASARIPQWYPFDETDYLAAQSWVEYDVTCANAPCGSGKAGYRDMPGDPLSGCSVVTTSDFSGMDCMADDANDSTVLYLPAGTYSIDNGENINITRGNLVIRGAGVGSTILRREAPGSTREINCDSNVNGHVLTLCEPPATLYGTVSNWTAGYTAGTSIVTVESVENFDVGGWIEVEMDETLDCEFNDTNYGLGYPARKYAHHAKVVCKDGASPCDDENYLSAGQIEIDRPLRMTYNGAGCTGFEAYPFSPIEKFGMESMSLTSLGTVCNEWATCIRWQYIHFFGVVNSWLVDLDISRTYERWMNIEFSARLWVQGIDFSDLDLSIPYDTEAVWIISSSDVIFENNGCTDAKVCAETWIGAEGTVLSYNFWNQTLGAGTCEKAFFNHGHYSRETLIEGNHSVCDIMPADCWWGMNGPRITSFRNRITGAAQGFRVEWQFAAIDNPCSNASGVITSYQNLIGNISPAYYAQPGGGSPPGDVDIDLYQTYAWIERNVYATSLTLSTPEATTDCGTGVGNCPGGNYGPANSAPVGWASETIPHSLYRTTAPSWWCEEACDWDDVHSGIGAWGDTYGGTYCKLPAEIRAESGTCTPLSAEETHNSVPGLITIATTGDAQRGMNCSYADTAWDHWSPIGSFLAGQGAFVDLVIFPGDVVEGQTNAQDCWCGTRPAGCEEETHPDAALGDVCNPGECDKTQIAACKGGTPGKWCEWTRIRSIVDAIQNGGAGVPTLVVNGNHDNDYPLLYWQGTDLLSLSRWDDYNTYFGPSAEPYLGSMVAEIGWYQGAMVNSEWIGSCPTACDQWDPRAGSDTYGPYTSFQVINAGGAQLLVIAIPFMHRGYLVGDPYFDWVEDVIEAHPGMLTILVSHMIVSNTCTVAANAMLYCRDGWTNFTGRRIQDLVDAHPQILATVSGHNRYIFRKPWVMADGRKVLNINVDYTNAISGAPAWQTILNGGGGAVAYIQFDLVAGLVSSVAYSPAELEYVNLTSSEFLESRWTDTVPICSDSTGRWDLPDSACPEKVPVNAPVR